MKPDLTALFLSSVRDFILQENLFPKEEKLLCAVSGGVDSMVLAFTLLELGYNLEIAHYNYGLRGMDSDADEELVRTWAGQHQIPFHRHSPPLDFRTKPGISLQEEARNLRYQWMESLSEERGIHHIVLAHHADDQLETVFLNLLRGTGLAGMRGMLPAQGKRKRPLLEKTRAEILAFAQTNSIPWREDASNAKTDYRRNQLRHSILPQLQELSPGFERAVLRNADRFRLYESTLESQYQILETSFLRTESYEKRTYDLPAVLAHPQGSFYFFESLKKLGFGWDETTQLWQSASSEESIERRSADGILTEIRFPKWIVWKTEPTLSATLPVIQKPEPAVLLLSGKKLELEIKAVEGFIPASMPANQWMADSSKLEFPLSFRLWKEGELFQPFGMKGKRKQISDLLTEAGLTKEEKYRQLLLEDSAGTILWVTGIRSSELTRIPEGFSGRLLVIEIVETN
jgi:tRNA(Ile)-lysidine synthase